MSSSRKSLNQEKFSSTVKNKTVVVKKEVEPFVPIQIPPMEKRVNTKNLMIPTPDTSCSNKEIEIKIEKDDSKDK